MSVISLGFLLFLAIVLIIYYIAPKRIQWCVLLAASLVFYLFAGFQYITYILISITVSYIAARIISHLFAVQKAGLCGIEKEKKKPYKEHMKKKRRHVLVISVIAVISMLAFLKYCNFAIENIDLFLGLLKVQKLMKLDLILPFGISFYTFQIIAYLVDVYRGKIEAQRNFAKYALFVFFFPQITEGPIARYDQLAPQLYESRKVDFDNLRYGAQLMIWGFFKKLVIADRLAVFVSSVYSNYTSYSGAIFIIATVLFSIQIYADFSGCMDIITGASEMFGIKLTKNFNHPYFARTMPEFWRRWHISLCTWFKDYVFYPISASHISLKLNKHSRKLFGNTAGRIIASCFPVLVVWTLTGLWHGSHWTYVMWGLYHGILIILGIIFAPLLLKITSFLKIKTDCFSWHLFQMVRTFALCTVARVFFKSGSLSQSIYIFTHSFRQWNLPGGILSLGLDKADILVAALSILVLIVVSNLQEHMNIRQTLAKQNLVFRWAVYFVAIFSVIIFGMYGQAASGTTFIYEHF